MFIRFINVANHTFTKDVVQLIFLLTGNDIARCRGRRSEYQSLYRESSGSEPGHKPHGSCSKTNRAASWSTCTFRIGRQSMRLFQPPASRSGHSPAYNTVDSVGRLLVTATHICITPPYK